MNYIFTLCHENNQGPGPFPAILGKGPWTKLGKKKIDLTSKLGEINDIEHYKGSKMYPQNQVILDCIMPNIPLKHKCLSIILIWVSVSHKFFFFLLFLIGKIRHGIGIKGGYFQLGMGPKFGPWRWAEKALGTQAFSKLNCSRNCQYTPSPS